MNARTRLQLRLQTTVEGLSVAAITYYVVGLFGYLVKAAHDSGRLACRAEHRDRSLRADRRLCDLVDGPQHPQASILRVRPMMASSSSRLVAALAILDRTVSAPSEPAKDLRITSTIVGETPVTIFRPQSAGPAPVVVIAHGFAGSQQLMQPFAETLARNGYIAVTFDFLGHGRNPAPMRGDITEGKAITDGPAGGTGQGRGLRPHVAGQRWPACGARAFDGLRHRGAVRAGHSGCRGNGRRVGVLPGRDRDQPAQSARDRRRAGAVRCSRNEGLRIVNLTAGGNGGRRRDLRPICRMVPRESWCWRAASNISACSTATTAWSKRCAGSTRRSAEQRRRLHR